jgi:hypothetical protein
MKIKILKEAMPRAGKTAKLLQNPAVDPDAPTVAEPGKYVPKQTQQPVTQQAAPQQPAQVQGVSQASKQKIVPHVIGLLDNANQIKKEFGVYFQKYDSLVKSYDGETYNAYMNSLKSLNQLINILKSRQQQ